MNWNIFKRIAELEARVSSLTLRSLEYAVAIADLQEEQAEDEKIFKATVDAMSAEIAKKATLAQDEKRQRVLESKRRYYERNKEKLLKQRKEKYREERRKEKGREYARQYYAKKKADMLNQSALPA